VNLPGGVSDELGLVEQPQPRFGCDRAQGFLYARPQPALAITDVLAAAPRQEASASARCAR